MTGSSRVPTRFLGDLEQHVLPLSPTASAREALHRFKVEKSRTALPVVDHGQVVGLLSRARLIEALARARGDGAVLKMPVLKMLRRSHTVLPRNTSIEDAGEELVRIGDVRAAEGIIVVYDERYTGMVSALQVLGALRDRDPSETQGIENANLSDLDGDHLSFLGHEIRTPLVGMMGTVSLLSSCKLPAEADVLVQTLKSSTQVLHGLLDDLIEIGRLKADRLNLRVQELNLLKFSQSLEAFWLPTAARKKLDFTVAVDREGPERVKLDAGRLRQILNNLIGNALKFTDRGQVEVSISATRWQEGGQLTVKVADTGCGIDEDLAGRLFQPFSRSEQGASAERSGSGLGLSVVKGLAKGLGGEVAYEPVATGGSCFTVTLPIELASRENADPQNRSRRQQSFGAFELGRVLIAEDHPVNRMVLERALAGAGWKVDQVVTGTQALRRGSERHYQAVLLDLRLPEMHGLSVAHELRKTQFGASVPLVAVTADTDEATHERCLKAGFDIVLTKPVNPQALMATLADLILFQRSHEKSRQAAG